jgi:hypothetical protein
MKLQITNKLVTTFIINHNVVPGLRPGRDRFSVVGRVIRLQICTGWFSESLV